MPKTKPKRSSSSEVSRVPKELNRAATLYIMRPPHISISGGDLLEEWDTFVEQVKATENHDE